MCKHFIILNWFLEKLLSNLDSKIRMSNSSVISCENIIISQRTNIWMSVKELVEFSIICSWISARSLENLLIRVLTWYPYLRSLFDKVELETFVLFWQTLVIDIYSKNVFRFLTKTPNCKLWSVQACFRVDIIMQY